VDRVYNEICTSSDSNDLENYLTVTEKHQDNCFIPINQSMDPNEDGNLGIPNEKFQETYDTLDNDKCFVGPNNVEKVELRVTMCDYPLSSSFTIDYFKENEENRILEAELVEIENGFQNISSKYTLFRNHIFGERLMQLNNMKNE